LTGLGSWPENVRKWPIHFNNASLVPEITTWQDYHYLVK
jgi:hypothetical protein